MTTQRIEVVIQTRGADKAVKDIREISKSSGQSSRALDLLRSRLRSLEGGLQQALRAARRFALGLAAVGASALLVVRQLVRLSDSYQILQNRIALVTDSEQSRLIVSRQLEEIAVRNFQSLEKTVETYSRVAIAVRGYNFTQEQAIQLTRTLAQAQIISGTAATEADRALARLTQGIVSNSVRVDELRTVLAQLPALADALSRRLGVSTNAIRELAIRGEIDAKTVAEALLDIGDEFDEQFSKVTPTVSQAFRGLRSQVQATVGRFSQLRQSTSGIVRIIQRLTEGFESGFATAVAVVEKLSEGFSKLFSIIGLGSKDASSETERTIGDVLVTIGRFADFVLGLFAGLGAAIFEFFRNPLAGIIDLVKNVAAAIEVVVFAINDILSFVGRSLVMGVRQAADETLKIARERQFLFEFGFSTSRIGEQFQAGLQASNIFENAARQIDARRSEVLAELGRTPTGPVDFPSGTRLDGELLNREDILLQRLTERVTQQQNLNNLRAVGTAEAQGAAAVLELENQLARERTKFESDFQKEQIESLKNYVRTQAEQQVENQLAEQLVTAYRDLNDELDLLDFDRSQRGIERTIQQLRNAFDDRGVPFFEENADLLRELSSRAEEQLRQETIINGLYGDRVELTKQQLVVQRLLEQETDKGRRRSVAQLAAEQRIASRQGDLSGAAGVQNAVDRLFQQVNNVAQNIEQALTNAFNAAEDALVNFVTTGEINFSRFVDSVLADITRLLARQALLSLFEASPGGAAGIGGFFAQAFGGARQDGGPVSPNRTFLVGEDGPELFTPGRSGTILPNGAGAAAPAPNNVTVVNVMDPNMIAEALNDPDAQEVIVNVISRNSRRISRVLGEN